MLTVRCRGLASLRTAPTSLSSHSDSTTSSTTWLLLLFSTSIISPSSEPFSGVWVQWHFDASSKSSTSSICLLDLNEDGTESCASRSLWEGTCLCNDLCSMADMLGGWMKLEVSCHFYSKEKRPIITCAPEGELGVSTSVGVQSSQWSTEHATLCSVYHLHNILNLRWPILS